MAATQNNNCKDVRCVVRSLSLCRTLCDPRGLQPPGSSVRGILQARIPERVAIVFSRKMSLECKIMKYRHRHYKKDPFLIAQLVKNLPAKRETWVRSLGWRTPWRRERLPTPVFLGFRGGSAGEESACKAGDLGSIPGLEDPLEKGKATHSSILAWRIPWPV